MLSQTVNISTKDELILATFRQAQVKDILEDIQEVDGLYYSTNMDDTQQKG